MPTNIYDSSSITQRRRDTAVAGSFINRIQNSVNPVTGYGPLPGIFDQSIINTVKNGHMTTYKTSLMGVTEVSTGCPSCVPVSDPVYQFLQSGWATSLGISSGGISTYITSDSSGIYITGLYSSTFTINSFVSGGGGGAINVTPYGTLSTSGGQDIFIVKYNTDGVVQWATSIGGTGSDAAFGISTDSSGIYITGGYASTVTIKSFVSGGGGGAISTTPYGTLTSAGSADAYVVKYNSSGVAQWATSISEISLDVSYDISVDSSGIYISGIYSNTVTINSFVSGGGGGSISTTPYGTLTGAGSNDIFVIKYNSSGVAQWATSIGGTGGDTSFSISADSSGVYVSGNYPSTVTINSFVSGGGGGAISTTPYGTLSTSGGQDILIVKYTSSGVAQWATSIGGSGADNTYAISADSSGIYISGNYPSTVTINSFVSGGGGGAISTTSYGTLSTSGNNDIFVIKYNSSGVAQWATSIGGSGSDISYDILVYSNNVYVAGWYSSTVTINSFVSGGGGGAISTTPYGTLTSVGSDDVFLVKYNTNGLAQWATSIGGTGADDGPVISVNSSGVYVTGGYASTITLNSFVSGGGGGAISITPYGTLNNIGSSNIFVVKYNTDGQIV